MWMRAVGLSVAHCVARRLRTAWDCALDASISRRRRQGQVEFWAKVGRAALDNPDLPASFIAESLMSMAEPREDSTVFVPRSAAKA